VTAIPLGPRLHEASSNLPGRRAWHRPAALSLARTARYAVPIRFCSRWGLPCRPRCRSRGALLPHLFTLTAPKPKGRRRAVRSLWHCPWGRPRRTLSGTVCQGSPDFPPRRPFDRCRSGRPADWRTKAWSFMTVSSSDCPPGRDAK